jgi:hypothetical protein
MTNLLFLTFCMYYAGNTFDISTVTQVLVYTALGQTPFSHPY